MQRRELAIAMAAVAVVLWVVAVVGGAPLLAVVIPIVGLMVAGVLLVITDHTEQL